MLTTILLEKLLEIERSLGRVDSLTLRGMLMEAQTQALRVEQELIGVLDEVHHLRVDAKPSFPRARGARAAVRSLPAEEKDQTLPKVS
jgi:hypothetical protein